MMFDEMQLKESCDFNDRLKKLFIRHKKVQVVQVRGLIKPWKQIIYYDFDENMNMDLLNELILKSENCHMKIYAISCDMGNTQLLSLSKFTETTTMFLKIPIITPETFIFSVTIHIVLKTCTITC